jgi:iron complex outermembrane recepter protein
LFIVALFAFSALSGQTPEANSADLKKLSLEQLSQIEVTSLTKETTPSFRTAAAIYVLTQEDIRRSGATTLPDLLRLVPGVHVAQIDSGKWAVGIRGFQGRLSRAMRVLIDGRSVYTPLFAGTYWEQHHVMLEDVERIEVVRGPGATVWGSNAVNGVINVITKNAKDTRGMLVSAGTGNVEQGMLNWRYGGGSDRVAYRIYGSGFTRGPQDHVDDANFDDWRMGQAGFRVDWTSGGRDTFVVQGDTYGTIHGQSLVVSTLSPPAAPVIRDNGRYNGQNLRYAWIRKLASGGNFQLNAFYDRIDRNDLNYHEVRDTYDVDFIHHVPIRRHDIIWGAGARISPAKFIQTAEAVNFLPHRQTYNIFSGFFQDEIALVPSKLALTLGLKSEHNSFSAFEFQPSARLSWTPNSANTFWGAISRAVRTPSRIEDNFSFSALIQPQVPLFVRLIGDGEFSSEQMLGYEFGYRRSLKRGIIAVSSFHNRYDDLLSVENRPPFPETEPPPLRLVLPLYLRNGVRATTSGIEIAGVWDLAPWWRFQGSYSYMGLDARNKPDSNDLSTVRQLEGESPAHKTILRSSFTLPRAFELDLGWRHVGAVPNMNVPAYHTGDFRFGRRVTENLDISLVGQNLLQPRHVEYAGNPGALVRIRRSGFLKLTWTL